MPTEVYRTCPKCGGDGVYTSTGYDLGGSPISNNSPCDICGETGKLTVGHIDIDDLIDTVNDILDKCNDIFEVVSE